MGFFVKNWQISFMLYMQEKGVTGNHLLVQLLKDILNLLIHQFRSSSCDSNTVVHEIRQRLEGERQCSEKEECLLRWPDIELTVWCLSVSPKSWVSMLKQEQIYASESQWVDLHVFTSKIYRIVMEQSGRVCPTAPKLCAMVEEEVFFFLQEISLQVSQCFECSRHIILSEIRSAEELFKESSIINFYMLYKLLLEISARCFEKVIGELQTGLFKHIQSEYAESFAHYILQKHQILSLRMESKEVDKPVQRISILERIKEGRNLKWKQAIREDGQIGIIVEFKEEGDSEVPVENYLLKLDEDGELNVMSCNSMCMKWKVSEDAENNYEIASLVSNKKALAERLRNSPTQLKQITMTDHVSTVGGTLGRCLAHIKEYDSMGSFVFDLSKRAIISGSFNYITTNIPLIGIVFATGGYTYSFYYIFSNRMINKKRKMQDIGFMTLGTASSIGSGLLGAVIGQSFIPVPFLGAFLGGLIGGFVGEFGTKRIAHKLESMWFKEMIRNLEDRLMVRGYWEVNKQTLDILGLARSNFYNTIPERLEGRLGSDKHWYAMVGFTLLSFNQSKKRAKFIQAKTDQMKKKQANRRLSYDEDELLLDVMYQEMNYEPSVNLMCIMSYFEVENLQLISCFGELEEFVSSLFSRIK